MRTLKQITTCPLIAAVLLALSVSCVREQIENISADEVIIRATASLPESRTKMVYEESEGGIKAGWKTGDTFLALEINDGVVTPVTFTATASADVKTTFVSSGAVEATSATTWVAVLGKGAYFDGESIACSYAGQDGSISGLEKCDFMSCTSTGETPDFDYGEGRHLSYALRLKMPAGVGQVEFNTCLKGPEWVVDTEGAASPCTPDYRPKAAKLLTLAQETSEGQNVYLAVPAVDYSAAGLIVTALSASGQQSQGKVFSADLSDKGGRVASLEIGSLIDRPLPEDAVDFLSKLSSTLQYINNTSWNGLNDIYDISCSPAWAPFNVGAKASPSSAEEAYGSFFAWGETEQRESYSQASYKYSGSDETLGHIRSYPGRADLRLNLYVISGTKYDVARVKWGSAWRMPFIEEMTGFFGSNSAFSCDSGRTGRTDNNFTTKDVTEYNGVAVNGRTFSKNGITLFLPFAGKFDYTPGSTETTPAMVGKGGFYYSGVHNNVAGRKEAYRLFVRGNLCDVLSQECGFGFSVRPVLAQDTDEPAELTASGRVTDAVTGRGIAGVTVSDGYTCCATDTDGAYSMEADPRARSINVTVPASYEIPLGPDGRPLFYKLIDPSHGPSVVADFSLTPRANPSSRFTLITVADAHVQNDDHLSRFSGEAFADIQRTVTRLGSDYGPIIGIALGDQLTDNVNISSAVREVYTGVRTSSGTMPFFYTIGNHDHEGIAGGSDDQSTASFLENFGPTDYSFDIGNAHVIVMDDIDFNGNIEGSSGGYNAIKYRERITGEKLHWLKDELALVSNKSGRVAIFCTHAPVYNALGNGEEIKKLLRPFNEAHIFSGHLHNLTNHSHSFSRTQNGRPVFEHNMQSLSGTIWRADMSPNGTPSGYGVYTFDGSSLYWEYNKTWKESENFQVRVYSGNDSYSGYAWDPEYSGKFMARVWDGDDPETESGEETWTMSFVHNGVSTPMTRLNKRIIDQCAESYTATVLHYPYGSSWNVTAPTWWIIDAPGGDPAAVTDWQIVAKHSVPGGMEKTYTVNKLARDYTGFAPGSRYDESSNDPDVPGGLVSEGATSPSISEDNDTL